MKLNNSKRAHSRYMPGTRCVFKQCSTLGVIWVVIQVSVPCLPSTPVGTQSQRHPPVSQSPLLPLFSLSSLLLPLLSPSPPLLQSLVILLVACASRVFLNTRSTHSVPIARLNLRSLSRSLPKQTPTRAAANPAIDLRISPDRPRPTITSHQQKCISPLPPPWPSWPTPPARSPPPSPCLTSPRLAWPSCPFPA